jgi:zinc transport system substrate-binding protein
MAKVQLNTPKKMMLHRIFILLILLLPLAACGKKEGVKNAKPTVLVSVSPYAYFVNQIGKDLVHVETLIPAGANPHLYEATPKEVLGHQSAALWIYLGEALDKKVLQFFRDTRKQIQIVDVAYGIKLLSDCNEEGLTHQHCHHHHQEEGQDLHIWLSPVLAKQQAITIAEGLKALLPKDREQIEANLHKFLSELEVLDKQIAAILLPMRDKAILVSHPAFAYFCRDYQIEQLSIEMEGKDPLPQHVTQILAMAKSHNIQSILTEPQYSNKGAELIAQSLGLKLHSVDPYAENYSENLLHIAKVIAD